ncbi:MAG TPA: hypothetical protein GXZ89_00695 [Fastidiosipila sp.]|nr:hypothetical protein [Fastidiosipila sp.]
MRILVKENGKRIFGIRLPTRLIFSKTTFRILRRASERKQDPHEAADKGEQRDKSHYGDSLDFLKHVPEEKIADALEALREMKNTHPGLPLVEVEAASGEYVLITL